MPKISIIIPVYNSEKYLKQALDSVLNQAFNDIEVICIDDCSTDSSYDTLQNYAKADKRIILYRQNVNKGQGCARNIGISKASGDYIMFLDPDDYYESDTCETALKQIIKNNNDFVSFNFYDSDEETGKRTVNNTFLKPFKKHINEKNIKLYEFERPFVQGCVTVMNIYKRSFLQKNNIKYAEDIRLGEDVIFYFSVIANADTMSVIDKPLYTYRHHKTSSSNQSELRWGEHFIARERAFDIINNSNHKEGLLPSCLKYIISSNLYWYKEWNNKFDENIKKDFYCKMQLMFKRIHNFEETEKIAPYTDFASFKYICTHTYKEFDKYSNRDNENNTNKSDFLITYISKDKDYLSYAMNLYAVQDFAERNNTENNIILFKDFVQNEKKLLYDFAFDNLKYSKISAVSEVKADDLKGLICFCDNLKSDISGIKNILRINMNDGCYKVLYSEKISEISNIAERILSCFDFVFRSDNNVILPPVFLLNKKKYEDFAEKSILDLKNKVVIYTRKTVNIINCSKAKYILDINKNTIYDFIKAIRDCELLVTDSLTAAYISIIFNKNFVYTAECNDALLDKLPLNNTIYQHQNTVDLSKNYEQDWNKINNIIQSIIDEKIYSQILSGKCSRNENAVKNIKENIKDFSKNKLTSKRIFDYINCKKCVIMSKITKGNKKKHYENKADRIKDEMKNIFYE